MKSGARDPGVGQESMEALVSSEKQATARTVDAEGDARAPRAQELLPERYEHVRVLGAGGFGAVRLVFDRKLERVVAMKSLLVGPHATIALNERFAREIKLTAGLSHPGIVTVLDHGHLSDGTLWYTMPEVRGSTLRARIDRASSSATANESAMRTLLESFLRVCETMAYAHSRSVIHRDLKPENIMIGEFGETLVMDWGIARDVRDREPSAEGSDAVSGRHPSLTRVGAVLGTPAYMAPEQARGALDLHGPPTDVFALGAILRELIGALGDARDTDDHLLALKRIASRATDDDPQKRYGDAGVMAVDVRAALDGAHRRARAQESVVAAMALREPIRALERESRERRARAARTLASLAPDADTREKEPAWREQDDAATRDASRAVLETRWLQSLHGALQIDPTCRDAHVALASHYAEELQRADRDRRASDAARFEELLRAHDQGEHAERLRGEARLTLVTDPPGARVRAFRYIERARRLVLESVGVDLGCTPIDRAALSHGSYLLLIELAGHASVRYPIALERGAHWDGCAPGEREPRAVVLPREGELDEDEVYVPGGYAWIGGDSQAIESVPARRAWIDSFVAGRFAITNEQWVAFLDDLVARGRERDALALCPRSNRGAGASPPDALSFDRGADGRFRLRSDDPGERWTPRGPVVLVSWSAATAYAQWRAERSGRPYRLLHELEREKAVRGADGRHFSWGDHFEPTWTRVAQSTRTSASRVDVDEYPFDESPYGFRQGVGNTRDFCVNSWSIEGPRLDDDRLSLDRPEPETGYYAVRGGAWSSVEHHCRAASRFANRADDRRSVIGVRIGRSFR